MKYDFQQIEQRWQDHWENARTFSTPNPGQPDFDADKPKFFVLDMFPYPSGVGLHVGHPLGYIATDIVARYKKMRGFNVLHPMGFDAFGLPAEQYAVEHNVHPRITTENNIQNMVHQLKRLGMGYDWDRTFATTDPDYVKWTQWIFVQMYHHYFDPLVGKARPISELVNKLAQEDYYVGIDGELIASESTEDMEALAGIGDPTVHKWHELDQDQQSRLLDEYRLAFMAEVEVNWCPGLGTVLANEEVTNDGRSERGNFPVFKRPLKQWMLRITAYCDRLIEDLDHVDWPDNIKLLQRNWMGKSVGAEVDFPIVSDADGGRPRNLSPLASESIRVFTTRPDTLFGATYMVLAPEHPLVESITTDAQRAEVHAYRALAEQMSSIERQGAGGDAKDKTGVFTGGYAINPVNGEKIPVWVADYVMMGYGTGAIMAVPAHDERDYAFASKFGLPIVEVVQSTSDHDITQEAWTGHGQLINSANDDVSINGLAVDEAKRKITDWLHDKGLGSPKVNYKLRDWLFSRQRYWGEPFPILHGPNGEVRTVDEADLPVELPEMDDFKPTGSDDPDAPPQPPLGRAPGSWKQVEIDGVTYTRELNTMPNWAGSCWYYLRYLDPKNSDALVGEDAENYWMVSEKKSGGTHAGGVDLYVGGAEHAVLHLLYARFWHKFLYDIGVASTPEPFGRYFAQGYIQAYCYRDERGMPVEASQVFTETGRPAAEAQGEKDAKFVHEGKPVTEEFGKMGKSLKNAIGPETICEDFGCDTLRLYEMYMGPLEQSKVWNTADIVGVHRFLNRLWRVVLDEETGKVRVADTAPDEDLNRKVHGTIKRVTEAMEGMHFNVAIAALIELNNALVGLDAPPRAAVEALVRLLNPIAPHVAEELWAKLGHTTFLADTDWPTWDEKALKVDAIEMPVQVNGKLRGKVMVPVGADNETILALAKLDDNVAEHVRGRTIVKVIIIPKKLINIVVT
ncbi:MAG: leucine--tRNA ligase [Planctomycetota bacterium]